MKVLVIHATAGAGHFKAAEAIYNQLKKDGEHDAHLVDALDYTSPFFKKLYRNSYTFMISKVPFVWAFFFGLLDIPALQPLVHKIRRVQNFTNAQKLQKFLQEQKFDCIISTHFLPNEVVTALKRKGLIESKLISVVTDFDVHKIWICEGIDHFCVASDWTLAKLVTLGINNQMVSVTGIPTDAKFSNPGEISELKAKLGLKKDIFTVLIATGSFGIGPIEEIVHALNGFQIIVVCGHNKNLYRRLTAQKIPDVAVMPLVDNMHELMAVSDAMVTKPGGLSISEALVSQLPLIFFNAIPGQEAHNVKVLKEYGIGISDCSVQQIATELNELRSSKDKFLSTLKKTSRLARPSAAKDISGLI